MENEQEFLERRAGQERSAAIKAKGAESRKVHEELADNYDQRLLGSSNNKARS